MPDHLLLKVLCGEPVERTPVWAMRQAGRWDPEFRRLRSGKDFYEFSADPALAAQASLLPERFGVDAIILFYDITTVAQAMGLEFDLVPGRGPVPRKVVATVADVERLSDAPADAAFEAQFRTLALVKESLAGRLPVLAFAGAPYTLATYCVGTGKDTDATRVYASAHTLVWDQLLEKIASATVSFLGRMTERGADAYQLFDSWAGNLKVAEYAAWCEPHHERIFSEVAGAPGVLYVNEQRYLDRAVASGAAAVALGTTHDLAECARRWPGTVFQGNLPPELLEEGTLEQVADETADCLEAGAAGRHILNLSAGMTPECRPENFEAFVRTAREWRRP